MAAVGDLVAGRYRLEKLLGEGGMGTVYEAVHEEIGKRVAIKFLRPDSSVNPVDVERFRREARAAAAAGHRNIVEIFDLGVADDGAQYLVMELLEGQSLGDLIFPRTPLDEATTAYVACQVLSALDAAHAAGIVHRDLKPDNLFLVDVGAPLPDVKLLDFGISHVQDLASSVEGDRGRLTRTGTIIGSPLYMSPEQALGERDLDLRTDIYAMGVILYECVTGRVPHVAHNYPALLAAIANKVPAEPSTLRPTLSPAFEAVILRSMRKDREERYRSAAEMFDALLPFVSAGALDRISRPRGRGGLADGPTPPRSLEGGAVEDISLSETLVDGDTERTVPPTEVVARAEPEPLPETQAVPGGASQASERARRPSTARWLAILVISLGALGAVGGGLALTSRPGRPSAEAEPARPAPLGGDGGLATTAPAADEGDASAGDGAPAAVSDAGEPTSPEDGDAAAAGDGGPPSVEADGAPAAPRAPRRPPRPLRPPVRPERPGSDPGTYVPESPGDTPGGARHVD